MSVQPQSRRNRIVERLRREGFCSVAVLAEQLDVSEVTIRTDLNALEAEGLVTRIHGGAILAGSQGRKHSFQDRLLVNQQQKRQIARAAAELIVDYESLILDASTTAYAIAEFLSDRTGLTVVTNGIEVALRLANNPTNKVILTGGLLRRESSSLGTQLGLGLLRELHVRKAFLSCTGWSADLDVMDDDLFEAEIKSAMCTIAEQVIILADATKFSRPGLTSFATIMQIDQLITEVSITSSLAERFQAAGVSLTICGDGAE
ncbi:MAG: DeoR/GlpR family DNA-binding transcription regulator [Roseiflexaceae bacterium]